MIQIEAGFFFKKIETQLMSCGVLLRLLKFDLKFIR